MNTKGGVGGEAMVTTVDMVVGGDDKDLAKLVMSEFSWWRRWL